MRDLVDLEPLREAFLRSGVGAWEVAVRLGLTRLKGGRRYPDGYQVKRALGIVPQQNGVGRASLRRRTSSARALELAEAIGVDPVDVGL